MPVKSNSDKVTSFNLTYNTSSFKLILISIIQHWKTDQVSGLLIAPMSYKLLVSTKMIYSKIKINRQFNKEFLVNKTIFQSQYELYMILRHVKGTTNCCCLFELLVLSSVIKPTASKDSNNINIQSKLWHLPLLVHAVTYFFFNRKMLKWPYSLHWHYQCACTASVQCIQLDRPVASCKLQ